jgi:hypothetical protein
MINIHKQIFFYQYKINLIVKKETFHLPAHPYALFHGLLGELLYATNGHSGQKYIRCNKPECAYCNLFKPILPEGHFWMGKYTNPPVAYILSPPYSKKEHYNGGDILTIQLTLIGNANKYLSQIISAFAHIGNIESTGYHNEFLFHSVEPVIPEIQEKENDNRFSLNNLNLFSTNSDSIIKTSTPLYLASKGKLVTDNILEHALQQSHLKYSLFAQLYCGAHLSEIEPLQINNLNYQMQTNVVSWWRNDNRNNKRVKIKAVTGKFAEISHIEENYKKILQLTQYFGIGQYSSYGMGKLKTE